MAQSPALAIRSYRIYFRDSLDALSQPHEVDLASDGEARTIAESMLGERPTCVSAKVWERARLVA